MPPPISTRKKKSNKNNHHPSPVLPRFQSVIIIAQSNSIYENLTWLRAISPHGEKKATVKKRWLPVARRTQRCVKQQACGGGSIVGAKASQTSLPENIVPEDFFRYEGGSRVMYGSINDTVGVWRIGRGGLLTGLFVEGCQTSRYIYIGRC